MSCIISLKLTCVMQNIPLVHII